MSLLWETCHGSLLDMASGFISEVFILKLISLFPPMEEEFIRGRVDRSFRSLWTEAKHLIVRVACLLLYCCVFFSASSGRGGLSSKESVLSW